MTFKQASSTLGTLLLIAACNRNHVAPEGSQGGTTSSFTGTGTNGVTPTKEGANTAGSVGQTAGGMDGANAEVGTSATGGTNAMGGGGGAKQGSTAATGNKGEPVGPSGNGHTLGTAGSTTR
jgi:hypothetical protein